MFRIISSSANPVPSYVADTYADLAAIKKEQYDSNMIGISATVLMGADKGTYILTGTKEWIPYGCCGGNSGGSSSGSVDPTTIISDSTVETQKVWSSQKTATEIAAQIQNAISELKFSQIDDTTTGTETTYSSQKIMQLLQNMEVECNHELICGGDAEALPLTPDGLDNAEDKGW